MKQIRRHPNPDQDEVLEETQATVVSKVDPIDDILDQIDQVLATDAQSMVTNFVQKGGQ